MKEAKRNEECKRFTDEEAEWLSLTPKERLLETTKLWDLYITLGGQLDPEPDPDSPFYFKPEPR